MHLHAAALLAPLLQAASPQTETVSAQRLRDTLQMLCAEPRLAGSTASRAAADYAAKVFAEAGLRVERPRYLAFLPRQIEQSLTLFEDGRSSALPLDEQGYDEDPRTRSPHVPPMHGLTAPGRARGRVVYAGAGRPEDFADLRVQGVELGGTIALMRYGGLYRGLKLRNAAAAGCAAALLYSDDADDGASKGAVLPGGPWRPPSGIQRGSVYNGDGDPLTPGWAALPSAPRLRVSEISGREAIPSLPISASNAARLFGSRGRPQQAALLDCEVELSVVQEPSLVEIENVIAWIDGADPEAGWVLAGAHRDAWGYGAIDNGGGSAVILEAARVLGAARRAGWQPPRSVALATWDAEEWGLVGSTEWVEERLEELRRHGVAYLNLDTVASGPEFGAFCTPGLTGALERACAAEGVTPPGSLGAPGGGSDHAPFLELAGVEVMGFGFHGGHGSYHSALDTPFVVERWLDPDFTYHAKAARMVVALVAELSGGAPVDGAAGWAQQAHRAAQELALSPELGAALVEAASALRRAAESPLPRPDPQLFLRAFLPPAPERFLLWRSAGYGSTWYPEIASALQQGGDPRPAVERAAGALRAAARRLDGGSNAAGATR